MKKILSALGLIALLGSSAGYAQQSTPLAGAPAIPPGAPLSKAKLTSLSALAYAPSRPPTINDDWTKGYFAQGNINLVWVVTMGVCTLAPSVSVAAPSSGITATASVSLQGTTPVLTLTNPGTGYTASPTVTVTGGTCTTFPAWYASWANVGAQWRDPSGNIYLLNQSTAKKAVWTYQTAASLPTDAVTSPIVAYGNVALNKAWASGNWMDVATTAGGTATTFSFINGQPDMAGLCKFLSGAPGYVSKWYDQSGNGYNAVQATGANQPTIQCGINTGKNIPSLVFDSGSKFMTIPAGAAGTAGSFSLFAVARPYAYSSEGVAEFSSGTYPQAIGFAGARYSQYYGNQKSINPSPINPSVIGFVTQSNTGQFMYGNNTQLNAALGGTTAALGGGYIGKATTIGGTGTVEIGAVIAYASSLSASNTASVQTSLYQAFSITPQSNSTVVYKGDSLTAGTNSTELFGYTRQAEAQNPFPVTSYNLGVPSETLQTMLSNFYVEIGQFYNPYSTNNILVLFGGTNDINNGQTPAQAYSYLTSIVSAAHSYGFRVVCATMLPRASVVDATRLSFNSLITGNAAGCDAIADVGSDPTVGIYANVGNTTYFAADEVHLTNLGYSYLVPYFNNAVASLLQ